MAKENIEKLGQLVEAGKAQELSKGSDARIIGLCLF
jgi:hypothetical protein